MAPSHQPASPLDAAVLFTDSGAASAFGERLSGAWVTTQGAVRCVGGGLGELTVLSVVPGKPPVDYERIITAVIAAHRPARLVAAGCATAAPGSEAADRVCVARRVVGRTGAAVNLAPPAGAAGLYGVLVQPGAVDQQALAQCDWAYDAAAACERLGVPVVVMAAVLADPRHDADPGLRSLAGEESLAGRLGAVVGALWRRPAAAGDLWNRQAHRWEMQERLAEALARELTGGDAPSPGDLSKSQRHR